MAADLPLLMVLPVMEKPAPLCVGTLMKLLLGIVAKAFGKLLSLSYMCTQPITLVPRMGLIPHLIKQMARFRDCDAHALQIKVVVVTVCRFELHDLSDAKQLPWSCWDLGALTYQVE